jgi:hypothetical protein
MDNSKEAKIESRLGMLFYNSNLYRNLPIRIPTKIWIYNLLKQYRI